MKSKHAKRLARELKKKGIDKKLRRPREDIKK